jgi:replicative DNA helicase
MNYEKHTKERELAKSTWEELTPKEQQHFLQSNKDTAMYNIEAEQALLGAVLTNNEALFHINNIQPEEFYVEGHQLIWQAILDFTKESRLANPVTLKQFFEQEESFEDVGGSVYLAKLVGAAVTIINVSDYADIIQDLARRRQLHRLCKETADKIAVPDWKMNAEKMSVELISDVMDLQAEEGMGKIHSWGDVNKRVIEGFMKPSQADSTGIASLDTAMLGGLHPSHTYYFTARMKVGKTALLNTIFHNIANGNKDKGIEPSPCLYICAEMGEEQIHQRNMARIAGYSAEAFQTHRTDNGFSDKLQEQLYTHKKIPGYFFDCPGIHFSQLQYILLLAVKKLKIKGFFLDYVTLVRGRETRESEVAFQERLCSWLSAYCKKNKIWMGSAAQINRDGNLRGGDAPLMYGDYIGELHRDEKNNVAYISTKAIRGARRVDAGNKTNPGLRFHHNGAHFKDIDDKVDGKTIMY